MNEVEIKRDYKELVNVALEGANSYIQKYYLRKIDCQSEDSQDVCIMRSMRRAIGALMEELSEKEKKAWIPVSERLPEPEKEVEVTAERHWSCSGKDKKMYLTCRAIYENGTIWREDSSFGWENFDNYEYDEERDDWKIPEGWFEYVTYGEESAAIDDFVTAWREIGEPYKTE